MPVAVGILVAGAFGYMGLPLMAGFAGEFFIFVGSFAAPALPYAPIFTALAMFGIVIVAGYLLSAMQSTLFGPFELETDYDVGPRAVPRCRPARGASGGDHRARRGTRHLLRDDT